MKLRVHLPSEMWFSGWLLFAAVPALAAPGPVLLLPDLPKTVAPTSEAYSRAAKAYDQAQQHFATGALLSALSFASEAWDAVPNVDNAILRAILLGEVKRHRDAFIALLQAADLHPEPDEAAVIEEGLGRHGQALDPPYGWAQISPAPPDAAIELADLHFSGPRTVGLPAGDHVIRATAAEYLDLQASFTIVAGRKTIVTLALPSAHPQTRKPGPAPVAPLTVDVRQGPRLPRPVPWILVGSGGALIVTALGLNLWAVSARQQADRYAEPSPDQDDALRHRQYDNARQDLRSRSAAAYALYAIGSAAAVSGSILFILQSQGVFDTEASAAILPQVGPDSAGLSFSMEF